MVVREDDSEEIAENIKGNLEEDAKSSTSKEEDIPQEEEDNLNESSGEDKEMYSWDELEYKANYVRFISNKSTERQVRMASAVVNKLEEPVRVPIFPIVVCVRYAYVIGAGVGFRVESGAVALLQLDL